MLWNVKWRRRSNCRWENSPERRVNKCGRARYWKKEFKIGLNKGNFNKKSKEFSESTTENFASTIYTVELRNYLILKKKICTTYKYRLKKEIVIFLFVPILSPSFTILYSTGVFPVYFRVNNKRSSRIMHCIMMHLSSQLDWFSPTQLITMQSSLNVLAFCRILSNWFAFIRWLK